MKEILLRYETDEHGNVTRVDIESDKIQDLKKIVDYLDIIKK